MAEPALRHKHFVLHPSGIGTNASLDTVTHHDVCVTLNVHALRRDKHKSKTCPRVLESKNGGP